MKCYDSVVIGAGNGGMGAALALAENGLHPLVIERHNLPGGCASSFVRGRFEFETALHVLMYDLPDMRQSWEGRFGITEHFGAVSPDFTYAYTDKDGRVVNLKLKSGPQAFIESVEEAYPGSTPYIQKFFGICMEIVTASAELASPDADISVINEKYPNFLKFSDMTGQEGFDALGLPDYLQALFGMVWFYEGPSPENLPFVRYALLVMGVFTMPTYFPEHRSHGFQSEFETMIMKKGGEFWYNTTVNEIMVEDGKVTGVKTDRGDEIRTNIVVSNTSPLNTLRMVTPQSQVKDESIKLQNSLVDNMSFIIVYLGLDASPEEIGLDSHHIFISEAFDYHKTFDASFTLEGPHVMGMLCYNKTIPGISPEGTSLVSISVPLRGSALEGLSQKEYFAMKERVAKEIIEGAQKHLGIDLMDHIEEISVATPATLSRYAALSNGGLGYEGRLNNDARVQSIVKSKEEYINGLYFVGQYETTIGYDKNPQGIVLGDKIAAQMKGE